MIRHRARATFLLPPLAILGALGSGGVAILALRADGSASSIILLAVLGLGGVIVVARTFHNLGTGVSFIPFVAAAVPISVGTGTQSALVAAFLFTVMLFGVWILGKTIARNGRFVGSPMNAPVLALVVVWMLAYLVSDVDRSPMVWLWNVFAFPRLGQLGIVIVSAGAFLLALNHARSSRQVQFATWSFVIIGVLALAAFYAGHEGAFSFLSTGGLFTMWGATLAYGQALFNDKLPPWLRVGLVGLAGAFIVKAMIFQTTWFSGWMPTVVAFSVLTLLRSRRAFFSVAATAAILVALNRDLVYHALWEVKVEQGDLTRLPIWSQAWSLVQNHLLLGTGPAGYAAYYMTIFAGSSYSMSTHSNYLDILAETGVIGSAIALWFFVTLLIVGWIGRSRWHTGFRGGFAQATFAGLLGLLVAMSLGDWFIPFVYNQTIAGFRYTVLSWVFLGYMAGLASLHPESEAP